MEFMKFIRHKQKLYVAISRHRFPLSQSIRLELLVPKTSSMLKSFLCFFFLGKQSGGISFMWSNNVHICILLKRIRLNLWTNVCLMTICYYHQHWQPLCLIHSNHINDNELKAKCHYQCWQSTFDILGARCVCIFNVDLIISW